MFSFVFRLCLVYAMLSIFLYDPVSLKEPGPSSGHTSESAIGDRSLSELTRVLEERKLALKMRVAKYCQEAIAREHKAMPKPAGAPLMPKSPPPADLAMQGGIVQPNFRAFKIFSKSFVFRLFEIFRVEGMSLCWSLGLEILGVVFSSCLG